MKEYLLIKNEAITSMNTHFSSLVHKRDLWLCGFDEISYARKNYAIVVDGEVYNLKELKEELHAAQYPPIESLEELFVYSYLHWKEECMMHIKGAYAFVLLYDDKIFAAKDPLGLAIQYYHHELDTLVISNSIQLMLNNAGIKAKLTKEGLLDLFAFGPGIPEDKTLLDGIKQLPMGCMMTYTDTLTLQQYYQLSAKVHQDDLSLTIQKVKDLVTASIKSQMQDVHASFLSGGLDSSIITAVCASTSKQPWHTYSLEYEGNKENFKGNLYQVSLDDDYIEQMKQRYPGDHTTLTITQEELKNKLEEALIAREFPGMADVDSSLLWLCEQVSNREKIILSGECSDEIFGGYPWFYRDELKDLDTFPWLRSTQERIKLLHDDLKQLDYDAYITKQYQDSIASISYLATDSEEDKQARLHTILCLHWFMQTLVIRQITMAKQAGITIRAPFADVDTLAYVYNIPWSMKFYQDNEKGILRKAFEDLLPKDVCWRKKNPFPKTHNPVYASLVADLLKERFEDPDSCLHRLFDKEQLQALITSKGASFTLPWYGQLMSGPQLLAYLYQIDYWVRTYHVELDF